MRRTRPFLLALTALTVASCSAAAGSSVLVEPAGSPQTTATPTAFAGPSATPARATRAPTTTPPSTSTTSPAPPTSADLPSPPLASDPAPPPGSGSTTEELPPAATPPVAQPVGAPPVAPGPPFRLIVAPCRVALLADSVGDDLMQNGLGGALNGVACPIVWSRVQRGSPLVDGVRGLSLAGGTTADVIVVLQGYSKAVEHRTEFAGLVDQVLRLAGSRTVVWTLYGPTLDCSAGYQRTLQQFNQSLQAAALRAPNLRLVDYPTLIAAHPAYSQNRCPHLLASGSAAVARWMSAEVRRLANTR